MSNLYIRVRTGFYTHRKTLKLRSLIGDDAFWVPPKLWAFAAENQPDGKFTDYSSEEIANAIGCSKHSSSIRQALESSGFLDPDGSIHDWHDHNGYHTAYAERAKLAAAARWAHKTGNPPAPPKGTGKGKRKEERGDKHCLTDASSIQEALPQALDAPEFRLAWAEWQQHRAEIKRKITPTTRKAQLSQLEAMGLGRAVAALRYSTANGWQGIYEQKPQNGQAAQSPHFDPSSIPPEVLNYDWKAERDANIARKKAEGLL